MNSPLRYHYQTVEVGEREIHIRSLRDTNEFSDNEDVALKLGVTSTTWPISGVLWPSSNVLASIMLDKNIDEVKILEIGCGLALSSIVLSLRGADITATDYNPAVEGFLLENVRINDCKAIHFVQANWENDLNILEKYDLIIGSDLLYEQDHSFYLADFINKHANDKCEVIIVDPNRGHQNKFTTNMLKNKFSHKKSDEVYFDQYKKRFQGHVHIYLR